MKTFEKDRRFLINNNYPKMKKSINPRQLSLVQSMSLKAVYLICFVSVLRLSPMVENTRNIYSSQPLAFHLTPTPISIFQEPKKIKTAPDSGSVAKSDW